MDGFKPMDGSNPDEDDDLELGDCVYGWRSPPKGIPSVILTTTWLGLAPADDLWWEGTPDVPFRPHGLLLVDVPPGALLHEWATGSTRCLPIGDKPVNLSSFEALARIVEKMPGARPSFTSLLPGRKLRLRVSTALGEPLAPPAALTVWGVTER